MILENQIHLGDAFDLLPEIPAESVDLIFTDPPYQTALKDIYDWTAGLDWPKLAAEFDRVLKPAGQLALFCDWTTGQAITTALKDRFKFRFIWIWQKTTAQPINKKMPLSEIELIAVYSKRKSRLKDLTFNWEAISEQGKPYCREFNRVNPTRKQVKPYVTKSDGIRYPRQILNFPSKPNMTKAERTSHPTQKPVALCSYIIKALSNPCALVLDPFTGSGSIPVACRRLDRHWIGIEKDAEYYEIARRRLDDEMSRVNLFALNET
ncbi:MAG: DNA methyltransferase [Candidatus Neomarinimicrobiota bacterium]